MSTQIEVQPERVETRPYAALLERLSSSVEAAIAFAPARQYNDLTIIPVARVRSGFGGGSGTGKRAEQEGSGSAGALAVTPVGYIEVSNGMTSFRPITLPTAILKLQVVGGLCALLLAGLLSAQRATRRKERKSGMVLSVFLKPGARRHAGKRRAFTGPHHRHRRLADLRQRLSAGGWKH
ncbi:MAG TPA: spore germination protein GerW family protein [Ktedonobacteraceae bacterium]|jgi:uncharacterized spore protein YtfJ